MEKSFSNGEEQGPIWGTRARDHSGSVTLLMSSEALPFSTCLIEHFSLNLQTCVFGRKLKPHVPGSFILIKMLLHNHSLMSKFHRDPT